jgi:acetyl esterase/lipase
MVPRALLLVRSSRAAWLAALLAIGLGGWPAFGEERTAGRLTGALQVPASVVYEPDLVYRTINGTELRLDLARPRRPGRFPAVICIHGGGWLHGSHKAHVPLSLKLAQEGFVAVTLGYRLSPAFKFPDQVFDVKSAVRWLRANGATYQVDADHIGVIGYSSGGTLACLLGLTGPASGLEGEGPDAHLSSRVQAVVSYYGLTDLAQLYRSCLHGELPVVEGTLMRLVMESFLGGPLDRAAERYARASPISYAGQAMAPFLLIHGTADRKVPFDQALRFKERLEKARAEVELLRLEGAPHDFVGEDEQKAFVVMLAFLQKHLKAKAR